MGAGGGRCSTPTGNYPLAGAATLYPPELPSITRNTHWVLAVATLAPTTHQTILNRGAQLPTLGRTVATRLGTYPTVLRGAALVF